MLADKHPDRQTDMHIRILRYRSGVINDETWTVTGSFGKTVMNPGCSVYG